MDMTPKQPAKASRKSFSPSKFVKNFLADKGGNFTVTFGIAATTLFTLIGSTVDYSRAMQERTFSQNAADSAVLIAAKEYALSNGKIRNWLLTRRAKRAFISNMVSSGKWWRDLEFNLEVKADDTIVLTVASSTETVVMGLIGHNKLDWQVESTAKVDMQGGLETALIVDVSSSMENANEFDNMKTGMNAFVDAIYPDGKANTNRSISLVPFGQAVNFGESRKDWLHTNPAIANADDFVGCFRVETNTQITDSPISTTNGKLTAFTQSVVPSKNNRPYCPDSKSQVQLFQIDPEAIKQYINDMSLAHGSGNSMALAWGWRTMLPNWKTSFGNDAFPKNFTDEPTKNIIFSTSRMPVDIDPEGDGKKVGITDWDERRKIGKERFEQTCEILKSQTKKVNVYMIGYNANDDVRALLSNCVVGRGAYYDATDENIGDVYKKIANSVQRIHLTN